ncbi:MAG: UvrB/UvrC motif-containing protein [Verrucomicrobiota bacterium]
MAEKLKCSKCDKEATVHLTQIVNNKIIKVDLCESCAQAQGVTDPEGFSLADLLTKSNVSEQSSEPNLSCPDCGLDTADFRRTGRLGCSTCFEVFAPLLRPVLEDMHVGTVHKGKVPEVAISRQSANAELETLENALARAIVEEAYEEAAEYRDKIQVLKNQSVNLEFSQS